METARPLERHPARRYPRSRLRLAAWALSALGALPLLPAQQVPDPDFRPPIPRPTFAGGKGPVVGIDEAHHNFHTAGGRYLAFANLLRRDGYRIQRVAGVFTPAELAPLRILVVANPLNERNVGEWSLPTPPAFSEAEVAAVAAWVRAGGSLLLIADHMPFPGAVSNLAAAFGVRFSNGIARAPDQPGGRLFFRRADNSLRDHPAARGRDARDRVEVVATFTGSAFLAPQAEGLLVLPESVVSFEPRTAGNIESDTQRIPVGGWFQGAVLRHGQGRVAIFGEAAMFTAQLSGPNRATMGMNDPAAPDNARFLLNVVRWLAAVE